MNPYQVAYYTLYLGAGTALTFWLGRTLRRSGAVLLGEAFHGHAELVTAIARLLSIGFYLLSFGFVAASFANYETLSTAGQVILMVSGRLGGFALLLGATHFFNLLLLAIFRRRAALPVPSPASGL